MIRRSPTRIELKLEDLQEYESRREQERKEQQSGDTWTLNASKQTSSQATVQERIGYVPQPRESS